MSVGSVHAWIADREMGGFTSGQVASHLVGMPGTAFSVLTVASYATRGRPSRPSPRSPGARRLQKRPARAHARAPGVAPSGVVSSRFQMIVRH